MEWILSEWIFAIDSRRRQLQNEIHGVGSEQKGRGCLSLLILNENDYDCTDGLE